MNRKIILKSRPEKEPLNENFQIIEEDLSAVQPGQVQLKSIYLSLDPYMRGRMNAGRSYAKPVELGTVMEGEAVSEVIESDSDIDAFDEESDDEHPEMNEIQSLLHEKTKGYVKKTYEGVDENAEDSVDPDWLITKDDDFSDDFLGHGLI